MSVTSRDASIGFDGNDILLGANIDSGSTIAVFDGEIDDIQIFDRALASTAIAELAR